MIFLLIFVIGVILFKGVLWVLWYFLDIIILMFLYCFLRMGFYEENDCMVEMNNGLFYKYCE